MNAITYTRGPGRRNSRNLRRAIPMLMLACGLTFSAASQACLMVFDQYDGNFIVANAPNETDRDKVLDIGFAGRVTYRNCPAERVEAAVSASFSGLTYVRNVTIPFFETTVTAPAFAVDSSPTSPLLVMVHLTGGGSPSDESTYRSFDPRTELRTPGSATNNDLKTFRLYLVAVSRGGLMTNVPTRRLGDVSHRLPGYPSIGTVTTSSTIGFSFRPTTCALTDPPTVALSDIRPQDLPANGSTVGDKNFDVQFTCNDHGVNLFMTLSDANDAGNRGSRLAPSSGSTAQGVRIELLRAGVPVAFGTQWSQGTSTGANQSVTLTARYRREAGTYSPGTIGGQATLVLNYN